MRGKLMVIWAIILLLSVGGISATWKYAELEVPDSFEIIPISLDKFVYPLFTVTYMVSVDGGKYFVHQTVTAPYGTQLISLDNVNWFIGDVWYTDEGRNTSAPTFVPAENMTLYGAYVFDIGAGDVNADGEIDVDDVTLYRRWIVGGYAIVSVAPGSEWDLVNSDSFNSNTLYFVERVIINFYYIFK